LVDAHNETPETHSRMISATI